MRKYKDYKIDSKTVEVHDLSFLSDPGHHYGWFRRHYRHHRLRRALKKADRIIAGSQEVAKDITRYYFIPKGKVTVLSPDKS